mmetsp:Transcript_114571/g.319047  ORF Transcript_114571/g.319047 Transcript_114571/m.319047 type:complete len:341 (+) Transcript_114571:452-1474(+)
MDLLVVVVIKCLERLRGLVVVDVVPFLDDLLEFAYCDGPLLVRVDGQEGLLHLVPLLGRQGPGHQQQGRPLEGRRLAVVDQGRDDVLADHAVPRNVALRDEGVGQGLLRREPLLRVHDKELPDEVLGITRDFVPEGLLDSVLASDDGLHLVALHPGERHVPEEDDKGRDPEAPHVTLVRVALLQDLRSHVGQRAAARRHHRVGVPDLAEAKVDQLQVVGIRSVVEEILELQIPVNHAVAVHVVDRQEHLPRRLRGVALREALPHLHPPEQLTARQALHNKVKLFLGLIRVNQPRYMRVVHGQEDLNLGHQVLHNVCSHAQQLEGLHRHLLFRPDVLRRVD